MSDKNHTGKPLSSEERALGMGIEITRRDFLNTVALGSGAALLHSTSPAVAHGLNASVSSGMETDPWTGYGGVGDYRISNGNTWPVMTAGHDLLRDSKRSEVVARAPFTGEIYDVVIAGGGFAGVIAAYSILKHTNRRCTCLILENHPLMGGEAKRNEFLVRGQRLIGPQGSNEADFPTEGWRAEMWHDIGMPSQFEFAQLSPRRRRMDLPLDNYLWLLWADNSENHGYFFDSPHPHWVRNPWAHRLEGTPWSSALRRDLLRWRDEPVAPFPGTEEELRRWLDTMTYEEYLTKHRHLSSEVARFADPLLASGAGLGSDALSAFVPYYFDYPGFLGLSHVPPDPLLDVPGRRLSSSIEHKRIYSFPGGNDGIMRALIKWLNPEAITGTPNFADVHNGHIQLAALDRQGIPCRMRTGATVVHVGFDEAVRSPRAPALVTYARDGKVQTVKGRTVIWAGASWTAKHAIQGLPADYRLAMDGFPRSPMLIVNVALDNWRALYKLGYTCCSWRGGFGYAANLRAPMYVGDYRPPLDPDQPTIFTFYVPFPQPGLPLPEQGKAARAQLFAMSYRDFELQIRRQLTKLFGEAGFDAHRDIAGIVLNRWGHAYVNAGPGFFFGRGGKPAPSQVLRQPLGNIAFAHSELSGHQTYSAAGEEGVRAARQVVAML